MFSKIFYEAFAGYRYILIYHLGALVFSNQLIRWCEAGFDYIAPPWIKHPDTPYYGNPEYDDKVGNGGFSLRRVQSFLAVLNSKKLWRNPFRRTIPEVLHGTSRERCLSLANFFRYWHANHNGIRHEMADYYQNEDHFWPKRAAHYYPPFKVAPVHIALQRSRPGRPENLQGDPETCGSLSPDYGRGAQDQSAHQSRLSLLYEPEEAACALAISREFAGRRLHKGEEPEAAPGDAENARAILAAASARGSHQLMPDEAFLVLSAYGIPVAPWAVTRSAAEAAARAAELGFPVAMKVMTEEAVHKSDVGGVLLNRLSGTEVQAGFERLSTLRGGSLLESARQRVLVQKMVVEGLEIFGGGRQDPTFGPVVLLGLGGA